MHEKVNLITKIYLTNQSVLCHVCHLANVFLLVGVTLGIYQVKDIFHVWSTYPPTLS